MKKVLVDAHVIEGFDQGTKSFLIALYKNIVLTQPHVEVYMACFDCDAVRGKFSDLKGINYVQLKSKSRLIRLGYEIPKIIKKKGFDVLHTNYYLPFFKPKNCRYVVTIHDVLFLSYKKYFPFKYRFKNFLFFKLSSFVADAVVCDSNASMKDIVEYLGCSQIKVHNIPLAVTPRNSFGHVRLPEQLEKDNYILYVSRLEPRKNHLELLQAFYELDLHIRYFLVFVGKKSIQYTEFDAYLNSLPLNVLEKIIYLDAVNDDLLANLYSNCRLFVYPSFCEGFGFPPLEAAQYGAPVITANNTSMADFDFFMPGMYEAGELEDLKKLMTMYLVHSKEEFDRRDCLSNYSWDRTASKYIEIFHG